MDPPPFGHGLHEVFNTGHRIGKGVQLVLFRHRLFGQDAVNHIIGGGPQQFRNIVQLEHLEGARNGAETRRYALKHIDPAWGFDEGDHRLLDLGHVQMRFLHHRIDQLLKLPGRQHRSRFSDLFQVNLRTAQGRQVGERGLDKNDVAGHGHEIGLFRHGFGGGDLLQLFRLLIHAVTQRSLAKHAEGIRHLADLLLQRHKLLRLAGLHANIEIQFILDYVEIVADGLMKRRHQLPVRGLQPLAAQFNLILSDDALFQVVLFLDGTHQVIFGVGTGRVIKQVFLQGDGGRVHHRNLPAGDDAPDLQVKPAKQAFQGGIGRIGIIQRDNGSSPRHLKQTPYRPGSGVLFQLLQNLPNGADAGDRIDVPIPVQQSLLVLLPA